MMQTVTTVCWESRSHRAAGTMRSCYILREERWHIIILSAIYALITYSMHISLIPRPFPPPVFDHLQIWRGRPRRPGLMCDDIR